MYKQLNKYEHYADLKINIVEDRVMGHGAGIPVENGLHAYQTLCWEEGRGSQEQMIMLVS